MSRVYLVVSLVVANTARISVPLCADACADCCHNPTSAYVDEGAVRFLAPSRMRQWKKKKKKNWNWREPMLLDS